LKRTWRTSGLGFTISANVKKATPRQRQSNLLQVVTQWKSEMSSNCGRALNSSQVNVFGFSTNPPISRRQSFNAISGLIPRSRIGKPWVRCWPGGRGSVERPSRTGGFPGRSGDFSLAAILRAQRSLRSTKVGLGVATATRLQDYRTARGDGVAEWWKISRGQMEERGKPGIRLRDHE